jgi:hypothetical protein
VTEPFKGSHASCACLLVVMRGEVIFWWDNGSADITNPMTTDMVFRIGRIIKQFTAVSVRKHVRDGNLNRAGELRSVHAFTVKWEPRW